jgi:regulator of sirC expression with transglutaminase-like and TPR domain
MTAAERFDELVTRRDPPLDELALTIAAAGRPDLDVDRQLARLDDLGADVGAREPAGLNAELFGAGRFVGDSERYYDADNSFLDRVLDRHRGIPITLSVLAIEIGRRRGVPLVGIGMPGHFLVRDANDVDSFFDPFVGGEHLDIAGCASRFRQLHPSGGFGEHLLEPVAPLAIASRMLNNLTNVYLRSSDVANLAWVLRLRTALPDATVSLRRQYAGVLANAGRFWQAADAYEALAEEQPERREDHRRNATRLRARLN